MKYDVYCEFDMEKHKETYINYLEVIITQDGVVHYAVPSHQEYMIMLAMMQNNWTRDQLKKEAHIFGAFDNFMVWLSMITDSVSVWTDLLAFYQLNPLQYATLKQLSEAGLFKGRVPSRPMNWEEYMTELYSKVPGTDKIW